MYKIKWKKDHKPLSFTALFYADCVAKRRGKFDLEGIKNCKTREELYNHPDVKLTGEEATNLNLTNYAVYYVHKNVDDLVHQVGYISNNYYKPPNIYGTIVITDPYIRFGIRNGDIRGVSIGYSKTFWDEYVAKLLVEEVSVTPSPFFDRCRIIKVSASNLFSQKKIFGKINKKKSIKGRKLLINVNASIILKIQQPNMSYNQQV